MLVLFFFCNVFFFFQAEDGIRDLVRSRGLGDVYKRQALPDYEQVQVKQIKIADRFSYLVMHFEIRMLYMNRQLNQSITSLNTERQA